MVFKELENALSGVISDLKSAPIPDESIDCEAITLDRNGTDNTK